MVFALANSVSSLKTKFSAADRHRRMCIHDIAMTSHFGPVNVDFLTSGRTNLKSISHDMVLSYIFFFSAKS